MEVKDGKAFATLTDVKNLIGEVFSLADEYGEVIISSYNKPKYAIKRLERTITKKEAKPLEKAKAPAKAAASPVTSPVAAPVAAAAVAPVTVASTPVATTTTTPASLPPAQTRAVVLWDRSNPKELAWVERTRTLL